MFIFNISKYNFFVHTSFKFEPINCENGLIEHSPAFPLSVSTTVGCTDEISEAKALSDKAESLFQCRGRERGQSLWGTPLASQRESFTNSRPSTAADADADADARAVTTDQSSTKTRKSNEERKLFFCIKRLF